MEGGVLGVLPGIIGTLQATEAIKLLTGIGEPMIGKLLHYDALNSRFKTFNTRKDPECKICGNNATIRDISKIKGYDENIDFNEISVIELAHLIENKKIVNLVDVRNPDEVKEFSIEGSKFIPLPELEERIAEIDQTGPIFLICKSGKRSAKAAEILKTKGMNEITNVIGGMDEWKNKIDVG